MGKWCRQARLRWYGHVKHREENYVGRRAMEMRMPGQRQIKEEVVGLHQGRHEAVGVSPEDAQDRKWWRRLVHMAANPTAISGTSWKKKKVDGME